MLRLTIRPAGVDVFREHELTQVHTWQDVSGSVCAYGYVGQRANWMRWPGLVAFRFDDQGTLDAFPERPLDSSVILDLCCRTVEPLVLQALGWETLHASAILTPAGLVGFCGDRQSGKSTIAYSLSRRGYTQHADDMVVLQPGPREIRALDRPFGVRLRPEAAAFFGYDPDGRHFQDVIPIGPDEGGTVSTHPLSALFVLRRLPDGEPEIERLAAGTALAAVLAHAYCFNPEDPEGRRRLLRHYLELAAAIPVYELRFGAGLDRLSSVLECIEATVGQMQMEPA
jgi:hypothetical protein